MIPIDRTELARRLEGVEGWFDLDEAWALLRAARTVPAPGDFLAVEIGAFHGRSTITLGAVSRERRGRLVSIDPHDMRPDQFERFTANVERAGLADVVEPVRRLSHDARPLVADGSVDVLFVDGSHEYDDVVQDVGDWRSALKYGAVAGFNDPYWSPVATALRDSIALPRTPFRNPRWRSNTVFVEYRPGDRWTIVDEMRRLRLRAFLRLGRAWLRFHLRIVNDEHVPLWIKQGQLHAARAAFALVLPRAR